jgi:hypothetical protein
MSVYEPKDGLDYIRDHFITTRSLRIIKSHHDALYLFVVCLFDLTVALSSRHL